MKNFCVALPDDLAAFVESTAAAEDRSSGSVIRRALLAQIATQIPAFSPSPPDSPAHVREMTGSREQGTPNSSLASCPSDGRPAGSRTAPEMPATPARDGTADSSRGRGSLSPHTDNGILA